MKVNCLTVVVALFSSSAKAWSLFGSTTPCLKDESHDVSKYITDFVEQLDTVLKSSYKKSKPALQDAFVEAQTLIADKFTDFNIEQRDAEYFIYVDVPGFSKDEVHISTDDYRFYLDAEHVCPTKSSILPWKEDPDTCIPRSKSASFILPNDADAEKWQSMFQEGVLKIRIARKRRNTKVLSLQDKWEEWQDNVKTQVEDLKENVSHMTDVAKDTVSGLVSSSKDSTKHVAKEALRRAEEELKRRQEDIERMKKEL